MSRIVVDTLASSSRTEKLTQLSRSVDLLSWAISADFSASCFVTIMGIMLWMLERSPQLRIHSSIHLKERIDAMRPAGEFARGIHYTVYIVARGIHIQPDQSIFIMLGLSYDEHM